MALAPAITEIDRLKDRPAVAALLKWNAAAVQSARFDRDELTIWIDKAYIREACAVLRDSQETRFNYLADLTSVDWFPSEPRFEVVYHLLSVPRTERVRVKVKLTGDDAVLESVFSVWPSCNFFEREVFDLMGIRFLGHPDLQRIMMPADWEGHPLRKDYPVEGYR